MAWGHLIVAGVGFDIAGAVIVAKSVFMKSTSSIWAEAFSLGRAHRAEDMNKIGKALAQQTVEARLGVALLTVGFALQAIPYFGEDSNAFHGWVAYIIGLILIALPWGIVWIAFRIYVPWDVGRINEQRVLIGAERQAGRARADERRPR